MCKSWANFPIYLSLIYFPIASLAMKPFGMAINYDAIWIIVFLIFLLLRRPKVYLSGTSFIFVLLFVVKYLSPLLISDKISFKALAMDGKYLFYIVFIYLWLREFKTISLRVVYRSILFFSKLYILFTIIRLLVLPDIDRDGILMEANYDGFMILLGVCIFDIVGGKNKDLAILVLATFCTFSRTGIICLLVLFSYKLIKRNLFLLIWAVPVFLLLVWISITIRGQESVEHLDRFIFFEQAAIYFSETDLFNILLGSPPGVSLKMTVLPEFGWYIDHFEEGKNLSGIYPFYFHSTYLRLAFTWGVPIAIMFIFVLVRRILLSKLNTTKYFYLIVLIQSVSLSALTIPNLSILGFIIFVLVEKEERNARQISNKKLPQKAVLIQRIQN